MKPCTYKASLLPSTLIYLQSFFWLSLTNLLVFISKSRINILLTSFVAYIEIYLLRLNSHQRSNQKERYFETIPITNYVRVADHYPTCA